MELSLSVEAHGVPPRDVLVDLDPGHTVGDLASALARHLGLHPPTGRGRELLRDGAPLDATATVREVDLRHADELALDPSPAVADAPALLVVGGPCTGRRLLVPSDGTWVELGRQAEALLPDPFVSRRHVRARLGSGERIEVEDLGSANGSWVRGARLDGATPLGPGDALEAGSSLLVPVLAGAHGSATDPGGLPDLVTLAQQVRDGTAGRDPIVRVGFGRVSGVPSRPIELELDDLADVAVAGGDPDGVARSLIAQLAAVRTPDELALAIAVSPDRAAGWRWAHWLPHLRSPAFDDVGGPPVRLALDVGQAAAIVRCVLGIVSLRASRRTGPRVVLVLDATLPWSRADLPDPDRLRAAGVLVIWVGTPTHTADVHIVPSSEDGTVTIAGADGTERHGNGADHLDVADARRLALAIARGNTTEVDDLPRTVALAEVLALDEPGSPALAGRWNTAPAEVHLTLGRTGVGPATVALVPEAPHLLVAGDARSGRSTALRTAVASAAASHDPNRLGMVLVTRDVRGFGPLSRLPHVAAVVSPGSLDGLVEALTREVDRRLAVLEAAGARSLTALRRAASAPDTLDPDVLVVVDGLSGSGSARFSPLLERAGDVGIHLVASLADRASGTLLAAAANRLQLRTADPATSLEVIGTTDAIGLPAERLGLALLRVRDGAPRRVQIASAAVPSAGRDRIEVRDLVIASSGAGHTSLRRAVPSDDELLQGLVDATTSAASGRTSTEWSQWLEGRVDDARARRTFMFTDIVGSTDLVKAIGDEAWTRLLRWHDDALRASFAAHGGVEVDNAGDGFFVAFDDPASGVACAVDIQRRLDAHRTSAGFAPQVRVGVHEAEAQVDGSRFTGHGVHEAARVGSVGGASEIVASLATARQTTASTSDLRAVSLKGVPEPVEVVTIEWRD